MKVLFTVTIFLSFLYRSYGCEIPVFRYALERWAADKYQLHITKPSEGFTKEEQELVNQIYDSLPDKNGNLNLSIAIKEGDVPASTLNLMYPSQIKNNKSVWTGLLNEENVTLLLNSPARQKLKELLLEGQSIVWVTVDSDEDLSQNLETYSKEFSGRYKLSEEIIQMDEKHKIDSIKTKKELDNVIRSTIPLKVSFSTLELKRNDPQEEIFLNMLLSQWPDLRYSDKAVVIPVFGRGRFLEAAPGELLDRLSFKKLTDYLCSGCSCTVKSENPGIDLLMNVPWSQFVSESILKIKAIPSLSSVSSDLAKEQNDKEIEEVQESGTSIFQYLLILIGSGIIILLLFRKK